MKFKILYLISIITLTINLFSDMRIYITGNTDIEKKIKESLNKTRVYLKKQNDKDEYEKPYLSDIKGSKIGDNYISIPGNHIDKSGSVRPIVFIELEIPQKNSNQPVVQGFDYVNGSYKTVLYYDSRKMTDPDQSIADLPIIAYIVPYNPEEDKHQQEARAAAPAKQEQQEQKEQDRKSESHPAAGAQAYDPAGDKAARKLTVQEQAQTDPDLQRVAKNGQTSISAQQQTSK